MNDIQINRQTFVYLMPFQRPGSSSSYSSNSSETAVVPPIHNKNYQESRYKTELCRHFEESGNCPHGQQCLFAHGIRELKPFRGRHRKFKTQLCKAFHSDGFCSFGPRCSYIHSGTDVIPGAIGSSLAKRVFRPRVMPNLDTTDLELRLNSLDINVKMGNLDMPSPTSPCRLSVFADLCDYKKF